MTVSRDGYTSGSAGGGQAARDATGQYVSPAAPPPAPRHHLHDRVEIHLSSCSSADTHRTVAGEIQERLPDGSWMVLLDEPVEEFGGQWVQGPGFRPEGECPNVRPAQAEEAA